MANTIEQNIEENYINQFIGATFKKQFKRYGKDLGLWKGKIISYSSHRKAFECRYTDDYVEFIKLKQLLKYDLKVLRTSPRLRPAAPSWSVNEHIILRHDNKYYHAIISKIGTKKNCFDIRYVDYMQFTSNVNSKKFYNYTEETLAKYCITKPEKPSLTLSENQDQIVPINSIEHDTSKNENSIASNENQEEISIFSKNQNPFDPGSNNIGNSIDNDMRNSTIAVENGTNNVKTESEDGIVACHAITKDEVSERNTCNQGSPVIQAQKKRKKSTTFTNTIENKTKKTRTNQQKEKSRLLILKEVVMGTLTEDF